ARATRLGVLTKPSRSGSSPMYSRICRTWSSIPLGTSDAFFSATTLPLRARSCPSRVLFMDSLSPPHEYVCYIASAVGYENRGRLHAKDSHFVLRNRRVQ